MVNQVPCMERIPYKYMEVIRYVRESAAACGTADTASGGRSGSDRALVRRPVAVPVDPSTGTAEESPSRKDSRQESYIDRH